jgi:superkiller protein 3
MFIFYFYFAGDGLCAYLMNSGRQDAAVALCRQVASRAQHAVWAWRRLGMFLSFQFLSSFFLVDLSIQYFSSFVSSFLFINAGLLLLKQKQPAEAILALQAALRAKPSDATSWEALGAAYQSLGRLTAALKAYNRAIELNPNRIYSLIQKGNLLLTLGDPSKALLCHETALKLDSTHPAALLGAAEALTSSAGQYILSGAVKAAGMELEKAAILAHACARENGNLVSAWKQLGDILLLARNAPISSLKASSPSFLSVPPSTTPLAETPAAVGVQEWQQRIVAVQESRKAFTKVLLLNPCASSAWHDVACTYYHESQLYRAHPSILKNETSSSRAATTADDTLNNLFEKAEWCLRGALRLDPANPELWTALGIAATNSAVKEYAVSRSLQLDPKSFTAWVALARLYIDANEPALAEKCLQQGRSQDPAVGLIWEAMAALAALSAAEKERAGYNQHAVGLGASAEGLLGFAEASLLTIDSNSSNISGSVYAAAHRAKELNPLNPAALNVWGLACEVKQDFLGSIKAYTACLDLLSLSSDSSSDGSSSSSNNVLLHQHPEMTRLGVPLIAGVKLNLARALCSTEDYSSAIALYRDLEVEGVLDKQPSALLSYAIVKACTGDLNGAEITARSILTTSEGGGLNFDGRIAAAAVEILLQLKIAAEQPAFKVLEVLQEYLHQLNDLKAPVEKIKKLWMMTVAAVAVAEENTTNLVDETIAAAKHWVAMSTTAKNEDNAPFFAQLHAQRQLTSISNLSKAVHMDPSALDLRLSLAAAVSAGGENYAASVSKLLQNMNVDPTTTPTTPNTSSAPEDLLTTRLYITLAALLKRGLSAGLSQIKQEARAAAQGLHAQPESIHLWYMSALLASQVAAGEKTPGGFKKALTCARCALSLMSFSSQEKKENAKGSDELLLQQVRLLICMSESLLHLPSRVENKEKALQRALAAVDLSSKLSFSSSSFASSTAKGDALRQVARCHWKHSDISQAEIFYRRAINESSAASHSSNISGHIASMELAACLRSCGRISDAAEVLHEEASRCTDQLSIGFPCFKRNMLQQLLLQETLTLAHLGELDAAKACAEAATPEEQGSTLESTSSSMSASSSRGLGLVAQGAVALQQALAAGTNTDTGKAFLTAARRYLTESLQKGQDGVVPRALLAHVEFSGTNRKKEEKVQAHAEHALLYADRPISGDLLQFLGILQVSKALCAKALHSAPWKANWWTQIQES